MSKTSYLKVRDPNYLLDSIDTKVKTFDTSNIAGTVDLGVTDSGLLATIDLSTASMDLKSNVVGVQANASDNQITIAPNEPSSSIDCRYVSKISVFGAVDQACTVSVEISQDNVKWYLEGSTHVASGADVFNMNFVCGARYVRLNYSASGTTCTATIAGKY